MLQKYYFLLNINSAFLRLCIKISRPFRTGDAACRKSSFRQAVRLSRMCLNFVFFRASLYKSTAARKKRKTQMPRNHQVSGHFIKKIKICLQVINKKLFSDITKHNVSLRRGSGALSTVWLSRPFRTGDVLILQSRIYFSKSTSAIIFPYFWTKLS